MRNFIKLLLSGSSDVSCKRFAALFIVASVVIAVFTSILTGKDMSSNTFLVVLQLIILAGVLFGLTSYDKKLEK